MSARRDLEFIISLSDEEPDNHLLRNAAMLSGIGAIGIIGHKGGRLMDTIRKSYKAGAKEIVGRTGPAVEAVRAAADNIQNATAWTSDVGRLWGAVNGPQAVQRAVRGAKHIKEFPAMVREGMNDPNSASSLGGRIGRRLGKAWRSAAESFNSAPAGMPVHMSAREELNEIRFGYSWSADPLKVEAQGGWDVAKARIETDEGGFMDENIARNKKRGVLNAIKRLNGRPRLNPFLYHDKAGHSAAFKKANPHWETNSTGMFSARDQLDEIRFGIMGDLWKGIPGKTWAGSIGRAAGAGALQGGAVGAGIGAIGGGISGAMSDDPNKGFISGAAGGALKGGAIGAGLGAAGYAGIHAAAPAISRWGGKHLPSSIGPEGAKLGRDLNSLNHQIRARGYKGRLGDAGKYNTPTLLARHSLDSIIQMSMEEPTERTKRASKGNWAAKIDPKVVRGAISDKESRRLAREAIEKIAKIGKTALSARDQLNTILFKSIARDDLQMPDAWIWNQEGGKFGPANHGQVRAAMADPDNYAGPQIIRKVSYGGPRMRVNLKNGKKTVRDRSGAERELSARDQLNLITFGVDANGKLHNSKGEFGGDNDAVAHPEAMRMTYQRAAGLGATAGAAGVAGGMGMKALIEKLKGLKRK